MKIPTQVKDNACLYWQHNPVSLEEAAQAYGISRPTLSRALREKGLNQSSYTSHKTKEEKKMLQYLYSKNINSLSDLRLSNPSTII